MKILNFFTWFFNQKSEYIGLSSFRKRDAAEPVRKQQAMKMPEKTALTGMIKRA